MTGAQMITQARLDADEPSGDSGFWSDATWVSKLNQYMYQLLSRMLRGNANAKGIVLQMLQADLRLTQDATDKWLFEFSGSTYPWGRKSIISLTRTAGTTAEDWRQDGIPGAWVPQTRWRDYSRGYAGETLDSDQPLWDWESYSTTTIGSNKLRVTKDLSLDDCASTDYVWVEFISTPTAIADDSTEVTALSLEAQYAVCARAAADCMHLQGVPGSTDKLLAYENWIVVNGGARA